MRHAISYSLLVLAVCFSFSASLGEEVDDVDQQIDEIKIPKVALPLPPIHVAEEGNVQMKLKDYLRLKDAEALLLSNLTQSTPPPKPPRDFLVRNLTIKGTASTNQAIIRIQFLVNVLGAEWTWVPFLAGSHTVTSHRIYAASGDTWIAAGGSGRSAQLSLLNGYYTLLVDRKGEYRVEVELREAVQARTTKPAIEIQFAAGLDSVTNLVEFEIPGAGGYVSLSPAAVVETVDVGAPARTPTPTRSSSEDDEEQPAVAAAAEEEGDKDKSFTLARAYFPPTDQLRIEWSAKETTESQPQTSTDGRRPVPTSMRVQQNVLYDVNNDGFITLTASFNYAITLGKQSRFQIRFDQGIRVLYVEGEAIERWDINYAKTVFGNNEPGKVLTITLDRPMDREYVVKVVGEMPSAFDLKKGNTTAEVELPTFSALDVRRENLIVAVSASPFLEITELKRDSAMVRIDPRELPTMGWNMGMGSAGHSILFSYTSSSSTSKLLMELTKHKDVAVLPAIIESATLHSTFVSDRILHHFYLDVKNSQKQYLRVEIPDKEYEIWSTYVGSEPVKPSSDENGSLLVPIKKDFGQATFRVEIVYYAPQQKLENEGTLEIFLPKVDIPITTFSLQLNLPATHIFHKFEGSDLQRRESWTCQVPGETPPQPQPQMMNMNMQAAFAPQQRQRKAMRTRGSAGGESGYMQQEMAKQWDYESEADASDTMFTGATFATSQAAVSLLDSGVLPVKVSPLQLGDKYCFERMLVHEKNFLSIKATYVSKEFRAQSWSWRFGEVLGFISSHFVLVVLALVVGLPVLALLVRLRRLVVGTPRKGE